MSSNTCPSAIVFHQSMIGLGFGQPVAWNVDTYVSSGTENSNSTVTFMFILWYGNRIRWLKVICKFQRYTIYLAWVLCQYHFFLSLKDIYHMLWTCPYIAIYYWAMIQFSLNICRRHRYSHLKNYLNRTNIFYQNQIILK